MRTSLLFIFLFCTTNIFAQENGNVRWQMEPSVEQLLQKKSDLDKQKPSIQGFRVQLYYGGNRAEALELKSKFASLHPEVE